jgi:hypothetical protein
MLVGLRLSRELRSSRPIHQNAPFEPLADYVRREDDRNSSLQGFHRPHNSTTVDEVVKPQTSRAPNIGLQTSANGLSGCEQNRNFSKWSCPKS